MTKTIDWGDGSGDKITLTYDAASGNQTVQVSSAKNLTSKKRSKTITFATTVGGTISRTLSVSQPYATEKTLTLYPAAYVSGSPTPSNSTRPVGKSDTNTTYAQQSATTGRNAESYMYYSFDTSDLPEDAVITSVTCKAKGYVSNTSRFTTRTMQMYVGTSTAKGTAVSMSTSASSQSISCGTWSRKELETCYIKIYCKRGTSSTTSSANIRFYGATLTIKYK